MIKQSIGYLFLFATWIYEVSNMIVGYLDLMVLNIYRDSLRIESNSYSEGFILFKFFKSIMTRIGNERKRSDMTNFMSSSADLRGDKKERIANLEDLIRARHEKSIRRRDEDLHLREILHKRDKWQ